MQRVAVLATLLWEVHMSKSCHLGRGIGTGALTEVDTGLVRGKQQRYTREGSGFVCTRVTGGCGLCGNPKSSQHVTYFSAFNLPLTRPGRSSEGSHGIYPLGFLYPSSV